MTSIFHDMVASAAGLIADVAGVAVEYSRGAGGDAESAQISGAVHSERGYDSADASGATITFQSDDWLILAARLEFDGTATVPQAGDQIRQTIGSDVIVYEVMNVPNGNCYAEVGQCRYRIHTKRLGIEAVEGSE